MSVQSRPWIAVVRRDDGTIVPVLRVKGGRPRYVQAATEEEAWQWRDRLEGVSTLAGGGTFQVGRVLAQRHGPPGEHPDPVPALTEDWGLTVLDDVPGTALLIRVPPPGLRVIEELCDWIRGKEKGEPTDETQLSRL